MNIRDALQYLVGLKYTKHMVIDGKNYTTEQLHYIPPILDETPFPEVISIKTLTGLVDYIKGSVDNLTGPLVVHVVSPTEVSVYSELRKDMDRNSFISCKAWTPDICYERFIDTEKFNIMLQACFLDSGDKAAILAVVGCVEEENVQTASDDGVTQQVTARVGIVKKDMITVPNPVTLRPFRTFAEVEQPDSKFVFRMQSGPSAALFEADGGAWRLYAMQNVKAYLTEKLAGCNVKIIS